MIEISNQTRTITEFPLMKPSVLQDKILELVSSGDLRQTKGVTEIISLISNQNEFDELFALIGTDRLINMRVADALEKISRNKPEWINIHKQRLLSFLESVTDKELLWHLVQMSSRIKWTKTETEQIVRLLSGFLIDKKQSKIVRVSCLQALYELSPQSTSIKSALNMLTDKLQHENIPSLHARLKKLKLI